jgi:superfamily II DNA helicase RecQ
LTGKDFEEGQLPNDLKNVDLLPSILFVSLEAMSLLFKNHSVYMKNLVERELVHKVFVDECHTILTEVNFRDKYLCMRELVGANIPVMSMSGSFPKRLIDDYVGYMFGGDDRSGNMNVKCILDESLFGDKPVFLGFRPRNNYLEYCADHVERFCKEHEAYNTHVIVSTVMEGERVERMMVKKGIGCRFIFSGCETLEDTAKAWMGDELRVLISTTLGLVGNESHRTQLVCIVGFLYDLPSVVQSIGRIRVQRRTKYSRVMIFTPMRGVGDKESVRTRIDRFEQLCEIGILKRESEESFKYFMGVESVKDWLFKDQGCRLVSLGNRLGYGLNSKCKSCDVCVNGSVNKFAVVARKEIAVKKSAKVDGLNLLERMKLKCLVCAKESCGGTCIAKRYNRCHKCFGNHMSTSCDRRHQKVLEGRACYSCFVFNCDEYKGHDFRDCSRRGHLQERLRGFVMRGYVNEVRGGEKKLTFNSFLSRLYASEEAFFKGIIEMGK